MLIKTVDLFLTNFILIDFNCLQLSRDSPTTKSPSCVLFNYKQIVKKKTEKYKWRKNEWQRFNIDYGLFSGNPFQFFINFTYLICKPSDRFTFFLLVRSLKTPIRLNVSQILLPKSNMGFFVIETNAFLRNTFAALYSFFNIPAEPIHSFS